MLHAGISNTTEGSHVSPERGRFERSPRTLARCSYVSLRAVRGVTHPRTALCGYGLAVGVPVMPMGDGNVGTGSPAAVLMAESGSDFVRPSNAHVEPQKLLIA